MQRLSRYIAAAHARRLPAPVIERAKIHLVDTFAAMLSGSRLFPGRCAINYVKPLGGAPEAGVIGTRIVTSALNAALANGTCGHADETDDTHPPTRTHPGTSVVPAALALAEKQRASGPHFLRAMVLGYDLCARSVLALKAPKFVPLGRHAGAHGQLFGATAAAAAMLKLDARSVRYAISYAVQQAAGVTTLFRDSQHAEKAFAMGGMPAHNGLAAALMVQHGFTGVDDVFSGTPDFFSIFSPAPEPQLIAHNLGRNYEILRGGIKRWCVGGPIQGPLHVLHEMIGMHGLSAENIASLTARIPETELRVVNDREMSDISLQHLLAVMLLDGTMSFAAAHDASRMHDRRVLALKKRITAVADASIPNKVRGWRCVMDVTMKDGRKLTHRTMAASGSAENPLTRAQVEEKALDLMAPVLGKVKSKTLIGALLAVDTLKNMRALRKLYMR